MKEILIEKKHQKLLIIQRNELQSSLQQKFRKFFGRYLFTNFFVNFFNSIDRIEKKLNSTFESEFIEIKNFLPKDASRILDIGSGLGLINIYIDDFYNKKVNFTLLDRNRLSKKIEYGFSKEGESYNNLDLTKDILSTNGIDKDRIKCVDIDQPFSLQDNYDIVISLVSMGYHYPVENYVNLLKKHTSDKTIFIFDIASEFVEFNDLKKIFKYVEIIKMYQKKHYQVRICCKEII